MSSEAAIPYLCFDSRDVRPDERLDYWQGSLSDVCHLSFPDHMTPDRFSARNEMWMMGDLLFTQRTCSAHILERTIRSIRSDQLDHYKVHLRASPSAITQLEAGNTQIELGTGECVMTDMSRPEHVHIEGGSSIAVIIPRDRLDALLPRPVKLHGVVLRGACSALLADHLRSLAARLPEMSRAEMPGATLATLHLVAASLAPSLHTLALAQSSVENTLRRQIRRYIETRLTAADLSAEQLCMHFRISRSTLYRLFEPLGGVARYVRERRLQRVHRVLSSAPRRHYLARVAEEHGFKSPAHFSRAFRQQFGYSPTDLIMTPRPAASSLAMPADYSLERWLHSLQG